jgi:hypothetical protein
VISSHRFGGGWQHYAIPFVIDVFARVSFSFSVCVCKCVYIISQRALFWRMKKKKKVAFSPK